MQRFYRRPPSLLQLSRPRMTCEACHCGKFNQEGLRPNIASSTPCLSLDPSNGRRRDFGVAANGERRLKVALCSKSMLRTNSKKIRVGTVLHCPWMPHQTR
mmetsp:Transcript_18662/g.49034  ORF Transcript_18662/g.49034 Transcript_18662/m.49034 type:complete len:101 (+) Transcript_18662:166-468(+)